MALSQVYVIIVLFALVGVAVVAFVVKKKENRLSRLASLAFAFILAGIFFGENVYLGYGLMGVGLGLAVVDIFKKSIRK